MSLLEKLAHPQRHLPPGYRRHPILAGVAAGFWVLVFYYLGRMVVSLFQGDNRVALFSLLWCVISFILWIVMHFWAGRTEG